MVLEHVGRVPAIGAHGARQRVVTVVNRSWLLSHNDLIRREFWALLPTAGDVAPIMGVIEKAAKPHVHRFR